MNDENNKQEEVVEKPKYNDQGQEMINCSRCGSPMLKTARSCLHCGELNSLNEKNNPLSKYFLKGYKKRDNVENNTKKILTAKQLDNREKRYTFYRRIIDFIILIIAIIALLNYHRIIDFREKHYIEQINKIAEQFDEMYKSGEIDVSKTCNIYSFDNSSLTFKTDISLYSFDYFDGYIQVLDNNDGTHDYILYLTDKKYGIIGVNSKEVSRKDIRRVTSIKVPECN